MEAILSLGLGYLIGSLSPSTLVGKRHNVNLKEEGTGNLGATNTFLVLGVKSGIFVALVDILKSYFSARIARALFPQMAVVGLIAGLGAILGHCFPILHQFEGGRGLAPFGGMILSYSLWAFLGILVSGWIAMLVLDAGVAATMLGCVVFPVFVGLTGGTLGQIFTAIAASALITYMHADKIKLALELHGGDHVRDTIKEKLFHKK